LELNIIKQSVHSVTNVDYSTDLYHSLWDTVCQWLAADQWFSSGRSTRVSSTTQTKKENDRYDI